MRLWRAGARVDSINHWAARVRELEAAIAGARARALAAPPSAAFFAFFTSQKAAAIAAQANLHPEDGHSFRVVEAPGPEEACAASASGHYIQGFRLKSNARH